MGGTTGYHVDVVGKVALEVALEAIRAGETVANKLASEDDAFFLFADFDLRLLPALTFARTASAICSVQHNK